MLRSDCRTLENLGFQVRDFQRFLCLFYQWNVAKVCLLGWFACMRGRFNILSKALRINT